MTIEHGIAMGAMESSYYILEEGKLYVYYSHDLEETFEIQPVTVEILLNRGLIENKKYWFDDTQLTVSDILYIDRDSLKYARIIK